MRTFSLLSVHVLFVSMAVPGWASIVVEPNPVTLHMTAGGVSGPMVFQAFHDGNPESITAWELELEVIGDVGADGTLIFNSAVEPSPYVFDGFTHVGIVFYGGGDPGSSVLKAVDAASTLVPIPATPINLLRVDFAASSDADGTFGVFARPLTGNFGSLWVGASPSFVKNPFANLGRGSDLIRVATVEVRSSSSVIPEPSTLMIFAVLGVAGLIGSLSKR